ncbi:ty3-gypsy retrotransposon protein [Tanacetum coccineum]
MTLQNQCLLPACILLPQDEFVSNHNIFSITLILPELFESNNILSFWSWNEFPNLKSLKLIQLILHGLNPTMICHSFLIFFGLIVLSINAIHADLKSGVYRWRTRHSQNLSRLSGVRVMGVIRETSLKSISISLYADMDRESERLSISLDGIFISSAMNYDLGIVISSVLETRERVQAIATINQVKSGKIVYGAKIKIESPAVHNHDLTEFALDIRQTGKEAAMSKMEIVYKFDSHPPDTAALDISNYRKIGTNDVYVLIDNRSTHNLVQSEVVERIQLPIKTTKPFKGDESLHLKRISLHRMQPLLETKDIYGGYELHNLSPEEDTFDSWASSGITVGLKRCTTIVVPLNDLLQKYGLKWGELETKSFEALKQQLSRMLILGLSIFNETFIMQEDASADGIATYQKELFAIVEAIYKWLIQTLLQQKYVRKLMRFDFVIEYKPMVSNQVADTLSRSYGDEENVTMYFIVLRQPMMGLVNDLKGENETLEELRGLHVKPLPMPTKVWEDASMDFITGLPVANGLTVILVVIDPLSKYAHFGTLQTSFNALKVVELFIEIVVKHHGFSKTIVSDRDLIFTDEGRQSWAETILAGYGGRSTLSMVRFLPWAEYCCNTSYHRCIKMSSYQALYGRFPPLVIPYPHGSSKMAAMPYCQLTLAKSLSNKFSKSANKDNMNDAGTINNVASDGTTVGPTSDGNEVDVVVPVESIRAISEQFANTAYGFFLGKRVSYPNPDVNLVKEDVGNVPVWVKLHGVHVTAFSEDGLSAIATKLALIEIQADVELKDNIVVAVPKLVGDGFYTCINRVEYEWKPPRLIIDGKYTLVDDEGKPLEKVDSLGDHDSEDEVASVHNEMASFLASKNVGYRTSNEEVSNLPEELEGHLVEQPLLICDSRVMLQNGIPTQQATYLDYDLEDKVTFKGNGNVTSEVQGGEQTK